MSKKYLITAPPAYASDQLLRFGAFGAVFGASLAAGTALAAHRQGALTREQVLAITLQGSIKAGLASMAGAALATAVGGPAALRLALMAAGSTAATYVLTPRCAAAEQPALTAAAEEAPSVATDPAGDEPKPAGE